MEFHFTFYSFNEYERRYLCTVKLFRDFFNDAHFLSVKFDQISWRPSLEPKGLRSVEIFWFSFMVSEI